ncbi:MAG: class I SAM-dependent methyltransferase [Candidatus Melainabacteria bacterium]|nr:class I SAM-dependent methyltransferase [Candidatus Melainabacteria bacterium]
MAQIEYCRGCKSSSLVDILDLGKTPLANSLLQQEDLDSPEFLAPLNLVFCADCSLVQITETVSPEKLFRHYAYFSSFSDTVLENASQIAMRLTDERKLTSESLVMEIASNDGYLLKNYLEQGVPVLGIEPAVNIAEVANESGIETISEFFGTRLAVELLQNGKLADVIHANNVLAHVPDLKGVVDGMRVVLKPDGIASIEVPYVRDLIDNLEFDTIYHEHLCYFSVSSLKRLFESNSLVLVDVERLPIHGGSLRVFVARRGQPSRRVLELLEEEHKDGVDSVEYYRAFSDRVMELKDALLSMLRSLKDSGKKLAAYGASAKGSTLLNFCGIGGDILDYVVDRSTVKIGLFTPGTRLPILDPEELLLKKPDYVLLLSWNHAEEIIAQQRQFLEQGGKFIVPVPAPGIIDKTVLSGGAANGISAVSHSKLTKLRSR